MCCGTISTTAASWPSVWAGMDCPPSGRRPLAGAFHHVRGRSRTDFRLRVRLPVRSRCARMVSRTDEEVSQGHRLRPSILIMAVEDSETGRTSGKKADYLPRLYVSH